MLIFQRAPRVPDRPLAAHRAVIVNGRQPYRGTTKSTAKLWSRFFFTGAWLAQINLLAAHRGVIINGKHVFSPECASVTPTLTEEA